MTDPRSQAFMNMTLAQQGIIAFIIMFSWFINRYIGEDLTGRIGRRRYVIRHFIFVAALAILFLLKNMFIHDIEKADVVEWFMIVSILTATSFTAWFILTTDVKRLHDFNVKGRWLILIYLLYVPFLGATVMLGSFAITRVLLSLIPGSKTNNNYGYNHDKNYIL